MGNKLPVYLADGSCEFMPDQRLARLKPHQKAVPLRGYGFVQAVMNCDTGSWAGYLVLDKAIGVQP